MDIFVLYCAISGESQKTHGAVTSERSKENSNCILIVIRWTISEVMHRERTSECVCVE